MVTSHPNPNAPAGFTLVELLVVVAILALLLGLLAPAVRQAHHTAQVTACMSQVRQITLGWQNYLADSDGWFPQWRRNMQWYYGGKHPALSQASMENTLDFRPLNPYVAGRERDEQSGDLFACPFDREIRPLPGGRALTEGEATFDFFGNSYMMNASLLAKHDHRNRRLPVSITDVKTSPSRLLMLGDCQWYYAALGSPFDADFHERRSRVNIAFLDGHAGTVQVNRGLAEMSLTTSIR